MISALRKVLTTITLACAGTAITFASEMNDPDTISNPQVLIHTTAGDITVELYNDTPLHRDNFLKLAGKGFYNGVLFHRVVPGFVVQGGDPESVNAPAGRPLGSGNPGYTIDAEIICPRHFHKHGALAAAREGDETNPERRSSGSQFYFVTGKVVPEGKLRSIERRTNLELEQQILADLNTQHRDTIMSMRRAHDFAGLSELQDSLVMEAEKQANAHSFSFTPQQREAYTTVGGTPSLDGAYTVFGEVTDGLDVVDKIGATATDTNERPLNDVRIISMEIIRDTRTQ